MFRHVLTRSIAGEILAIRKCELAMVIVDDLSCSDILTCNRAVLDIVFVSVPLATLVQTSLGLYRSPTGPGR